MKGEKLEKGANLQATGERVLRISHDGEYRFTRPFGSEEPCLEAYREGAWINVTECAESIDPDDNQDILVSLYYDAAMAFAGVNNDTEPGQA